MYVTLHLESAEIRTVIFKEGKKNNFKNSRVVLNETPDQPVFYMVPGR